MMLFHQISEFLKWKALDMEKRDLTKMNLDPLLDQGTTRREIIANVIMFWPFHQYHEVNFMDQSVHCHWWYQNTQRGMVCVYVWGDNLKHNDLSFKVKNVLLLHYSKKTVLFFPLSAQKKRILVDYTTIKEKITLNHRWEWKFLHYQNIMVIYPYPFLVVINLLFSWIIFNNDCICILTGSHG